MGGRQSTFREALIHRRKRTGFIPTNQPASLLFLRVGQIVAQMRGLVVGCILPADRETVDVVVHQCGYGIGRGDISREDVQVGSIA